MPDRLVPAGTTGIVFIHGFVCNRGFWSPWMRAAAERGVPCIAVNLEPVFGSIEQYGGSIGAAVDAMRQATGRPPVLVCHSMGGLAARAWLRHAGAGRVAHVVTIGTPHGGTWLARFSRSGNGRQMRLGGSWVERLRQDEEVNARPPFTCWYSNCDNIVFPVSTAALAGADNRFVPGAAHVHLAFIRRVMDETLTLVAAL